MNILICNDDGIMSNGIVSVAKRLAVSHNVLVVAPDGNRSAASHSLTISSIIKMKECFHIDRCKAYALSGTPADCVKFAELFFKGFKADIVVSGINKGHNIGSDILYSATVSTAIEAAFFDKIAFAFSAFSLGESDFDTYARYAENIIYSLLPISKIGDIWNVNFPDPSLGEIKGVKFTKLGKQLYSDRYEKVSENEYRLVGELIDHNQNDADCDIEWSKKGYITITPILLNKTNHKRIKEVKNICVKL